MPDESNQSGPLSAAQHEQLAAATIRSRPIRAAAGVARFNAWTIGIFAALSAPFALFSLVGVILTIGMAVIAFNEAYGRRRLLRFDLSAPAFLGWNQVGFMALLVGYSLWMMSTTVFGASSFEAELAAKPELREILGSAEELGGIVQLVVVGFYSLLIVLSAIFQGGNAVYYFSRRKALAAYIQSTPDWVRQIQVANL